MFAGLSSDLQKGVFPQDLPALKRQFNIALVKKNAVLKLPYHFWTNDPKINPSSAQLAWVAFILEDCESFTQVEVIITQEVEGRIGGERISADLLEKAVHKQLRTIVTEFLNLAPNEVFRELLFEKIKSCKSSLLSMLKEDSGHRL